MARVIVSEFAAKKLLLGDAYQGFSVSKESDLKSLQLDRQLTYVVKVDDSTKKRNKLNLLKLNIEHADVFDEVTNFLKGGYKRVLIEPFVEHDVDTERYLSFTITRIGVQILYSDEGGNDVEESTALQLYTIPRADFIAGKFNNRTDLPDEVFEILLAFMRQNHASFVEMNPLIADYEGAWWPLDMAVELDSAKQIFWSSLVRDHISSQKTNQVQEENVTSLNEKTNATFSLKILQPNASIFTLLSGGGASLVTMDSLVQIGLQEQIANYSEYSGAPNRIETRTFAREIISALINSTAKKKVLVVAGGVANFTDVFETLSGILEACQEQLPELIDQELLIVIRRGGPRQTTGLQQARDFFREHGLRARVSDSAQSFSDMAYEIKEYLNQE